MKVTLSFPSSLLSPNNRKHWAEKMPVKNAAKLEAKLAGAKLDYKHNGQNIHILVKFYPPKNNRDEDNCMASAKAYLDGFASGIRVNDKFFRVKPRLCKADPQNPRMEFIILNEDSVKSLEAIFDSL